jgi:hypothetical protein
MRRHPEALDGVGELAAAVCVPGAMEVPGRSGATGARLVMFKTHASRPRR